MTETQQVTAGEEWHGRKLPESVRLDSELQLTRKHPVSRTATIFL